MLQHPVTVSGRNMAVGEALHAHVVDQMETLSQKFFGRLVTCRVVFTRQPKGHSFACQIQVIVGHALYITADAEFDDVYACFKRACGNLGTQLRRKKEALHDDKPDGPAKDAVLNELSRPDLNEEY